MADKIVEIQFGSHLYGTNTPESDLDFKGVHLPSGREIVLQRVSDSISHHRPKAENERNTPDDIDRESYSLQRYLKLLADGQTVAIDMLFAPSSSIVCTSALWCRIQGNRERFLSKKSTAFVGYCRTQANKYGIKGSRVAAARNAAEFFEIAERKNGSFAKVQQVAELLPLDEHSRIVSQVCNSAGDIGTYYECCNRKVDFKATLKQAREIFSRIYENYGDRAKQADQDQGIDWKALSHAVRVGTEAIELLEQARVTFPLINASHILDIKKGRLPYNQVAEEIEELLVKVEEASVKSSLPDNPDYEFIDRIVYEAYRDQVYYH
jgi:ribosome-binding protein aMBF1 (putative translation factor)